MIDQTKRFQGRGIRIDFVGEGQVYDEVVMAVISGQVQLVYISPEKHIAELQILQHDLWVTIPGELEGTCCE